jgi:membrane protein YfhO
LKLEAPVESVSLADSTSLSARMRVHRDDIAAISVLLLLIAIKSWERLHFDEWMGRVDVLNQYLPWWSYLGERLRNGDIPGWNPYQFGGTPFLGDPQSGWMYLPVMLVFTIFPPVFAFKAYVVLHLLIAGLSTYAFARILAFRPIASLAAAVAFTFGTFIQHTTYCCNIQAHIAAWIPLALIGIELAIRARTWSGRLIGWTTTGLAISQMLAGWIGQGSYNGLLLIGSYLFYRVALHGIWKTPDLRRRLRSLVLHGSAVLLIGLGLGAAAALPRLDVNQESNLANGQYVNVEEADPDVGATVGTILARSIGPNFESRRTSLGMITLALALMAPFVAWRRVPVPYFAVFTVVVLTLTHKPTPLHSIFYLLPSYKMLHEHEVTRVLAVLMIGPAILAGATIDALPRLSKYRLLLAAGVPVLGIVLARLAMEDWRHYLLSPNQPTIRAVALVVLLILGAVLCGVLLSQQASARIRNTWLPLAIIVILIWEPSGRDLVGQLRHSPVEPRTHKTIEANVARTDSSGAGDFLLNLQAGSREPFRYVGYDGANLRTLANENGFVYHSRIWSPPYRRLLIGPRSIRLGLYALQGYNPVQLRTTVDLFREMNGQALEYHDGYILPRGLWSPWLNTLNVQYFVVPPVVPPGRPDLFHLAQQNPIVFANDRVWVLANPEASSYAWVVHDVETMESSAALEAIGSQSLDPESVATLDPGATIPPLAPTTIPGNEHVAVDYYSADKIEMTARLESDGIVVISEVHDPGWKAYVDDEPAQILLVDGALRGIAVAQGDHKIELRYAPRSIPVGLAITGLTLSLVLGAIVILRRRRDPAEPSNLGRITL